MDWTDIERVRVSGFTLTRRGYDKREVDRFVEGLAEWLETDAPQELGDQAVQRKLELVGQSTAHILLTTEKEAQELRRKTEQECAALRAEAETAALETRRRADDYAVKVREKADEDARNTTESANARARQAVEEATAKARQTVEEGDRRRAHAEGIVTELERRRDATLDDLERLRAELVATISKHTTRTTTEARNGTEGRRRHRPEREREREPEQAKAEAVDAEPAEA